MKRFIVRTRQRGYVFCWVYRWSKEMFVKHFQLIYSYYENERIMKGFVLRRVCSYMLFHKEHSCDANLSLSKWSWDFNLSLYTKDDGSLMVTMLFWYHEHSWFLRREAFLSFSFPELWYEMCAVFEFFCAGEPSHYLCYWKEVDFELLRTVRVQKAKEFKSKAEKCFQNSIAWITPLSSVG